ncbi:MAG: hypothetical protein WAM97_20345 [Acidimicrobiales bacterium]
MGNVENYQDAALLNGISCFSPHQCIVVGSLGYANTAPYSPLAAKWNKSGFTVMTTPKGGETNDLTSVSCLSATFCMAAGWDDSQAQEPLVEELTGTTWTVQQTPALSSGGLLSGISCSSEISCTAVGSSDGAALVETWNGSAWNAVFPPAPQGSSSSSLTSSWCTQTKCIAVGTYSSGSSSGALAEFWNGSTWKIEATPEPVGSVDASLSAVSCASIKACKAVGDYSTGGTSGIFADSWSGTDWTLDTLGQPAGSTQPSLQGVSCLSGASLFCVAAGDKTQPNGNDQVVAEQWSENAWASQTSPEVEESLGGSLDSVSCPDSETCYSVGSFGIDGWNGSAWSIQSTQGDASEGNEYPSSLNGVSCEPGSEECVAVGSGTWTASGEPDPGFPWVAESSESGAWSDGTTLGEDPGELEGASCYATACIAVGGNEMGTALIEAWAGSSWESQSPAIPPGATATMLTAVSCSSAPYCVAIGSYTNSSGDTTPLAERSKGGSWKVETLPTPDGSTSMTITAVSCASASSCIAVGSNATASGTTEEVALIWDGTSWQINSPSEPEGSSGSSLTGVSCVSSSACTVVGSYYTSSPSSPAALVQAWDGSTWRMETTPVPAGATAVGLSAVSCWSSGSTAPCMAVGSYTGSSGARSFAETSAS